MKRLNYIKTKKNKIWCHKSNSDKRNQFGELGTRVHSKKFGGLGVMDLATFNLALILKWYWKWAKLQQNLMNPLLAHMPITQEMMPHTELFTIKAAGAFSNMIGGAGY